MTVLLLSKKATINVATAVQNTNNSNNVMVTKAIHMPRQHHHHQQQQQHKLAPILLMQMLTATAAAAATTTTKIMTTTTATATTFLTPTAVAATFYQQMNNDSSSSHSAADSINSSNSSSSIGSGSNSNNTNTNNSNDIVNDDNNNLNYHNITLKAALDTIDAVNSYLSDMAWPKALIVVIFLLLILITIVGNTLVILAVLTTRRLRTVTNCFVMNLAITDWLVGTCVMPPAVMKYVLGSWRFGWILCDIWISLDVLLCTGSILSLCAISLDRYLAVIQPLTYSKKRRSKRLALFMIFIVWVTALSITCPPFLGWYEPGRRKEGYADCRYNQNKGYVVFSAMGSFFIPLAVMLYVYLKIGYVLTSRRQRIVRDANSERTADHDIDCDNFISESEHFQCAAPKFPSFKTRWSNGGGLSSKQSSLKCNKCDKNSFCNGAHGNGVQPTHGLTHQASFYELVEVSRLSSLIHCSTINCKYGSPCMHVTAAEVAASESRASTLPLKSMHYTESRSSFSETCLTAAQSAVRFVGDNQHHHQEQHQPLQQSKHQGHRNSHPHPHSHRVPMRVSTTKRDTKTTKTLTIVMGGFIACWLPFFIYYILIPFLPPAAVFEDLMNFLTWVGWVNCGINPFIYAFYNPDFRTAFWRLTCRRICKQKPAANHLFMFRGG